MDLPKKSANKYANLIEKPGPVRLSYGQAWTWNVSAQPETSPARSKIVWSKVCSGPARPMNTPRYRPLLRLVDSPKCYPIHAIGWYRSVCSFLFVIFFSSPILFVISVSGFWISGVFFVCNFNLEILDIWGHLTLEVLVLFHFSKDNLHSLILATECLFIL